MPHRSLAAEELCPCRKCVSRRATIICPRGLREEAMTDQDIDFFNAGGSQFLAGRDQRPARVDHIVDEHGLRLQLCRQGREGGRLSLFSFFQSMASRPWASLPLSSRPRIGGWPRGRAPRWLHRLAGISEWRRQREGLWIEKSGGWETIAMSRSLCTSTVSTWSIPELFRSAPAHAVPKLSPGLSLSCLL